MIDLDDKMPVPEGFQAMTSGSPFVELVGPLYFKETEDGVVVGLLVEPKHCNRAGTVHGGLISTLADIALGSNIAQAGVSEQELAVWRSTGKLPEKPTPRVTVNLSTDFCGSARVGDWIEMHVQIRRLGQSLSFATAQLKSKENTIASASGIYRTLA